MSRHLALIPDNNLVHQVGWYDRHAITSDVATTEQQRNAAARYLDRHAPDLADMILGGAA